MNHIGRVYREIAINRLRRMYPAGDFNNFFRYKEFDDVEGSVGIEYVIEAVIEELSNQLIPQGIILPDDICDVICFSKAPKKALSDCIDAIAAAKLSRDFKAMMTLRLLEKVYRQQVLESFSNIIATREYYRLMHFALVSFDTIMEGYDVVYPILTLLNLRPEHKDIRAAYNELQQCFLSLHNIKSKRSLKAKIKKFDCVIDADWAELQVSREQIEDSADLIVDQILEHSKEIVLKK